MPSARTDMSNQGLSLRYGFCFAKTLSGGSNRASLEGECQGLDGCCSFLSSYGPPAQGTASTLFCAALHFSQVPKQKHLQRQQAVLSLMVRRSHRWVVKSGGWAICRKVSTLRATSMILEWTTCVIWSLVTSA